MGSANQSAVCKPGYLYRHWSTAGHLLYIGISLNAVARLAQHKDKPWFPRIAKITVERFETYADAEVAELRAICYEGPIHNMRGPRDAKDLGPALTKLRAAQRKAASRETPKMRRLRDDYEVDKWFRSIPEGTTFEEYVARPEIRTPEARAKNGRRSKPASDR